jgi:hypothetical protein
MLRTFEDSSQTFLDALVDLMPDEFLPPYMKYLEPYSRVRFDITCQYGLDEPISDFDERERLLFFLFWEESKCTDLIERSGGHYS